MLVRETAQLGILLCRFAAGPNPNCPSRLPPPYRLQASAARSSALPHMRQLEGRADEVMCLLLL